MALNFYHKIGNLTIKRGDNEYNVGIWDGNCLAVFNAEYKDETGRDMVYLYSFFADEQHVNNILKNHEGDLFCDEVVKVELNTYYEGKTFMGKKDFKKLLEIFIKQRYDIHLYYAEPIK